MASEKIFAEGALPAGPSAYMSADKKLAFAQEMDTLYSQNMKTEVFTKTSREERQNKIDMLLLQAANATVAEKTAINRKLAALGVYEFEGEVLNAPATTRSGSNNVTVSTPLVYY